MLPQGASEGEGESSHLGFLSSDPSNGVGEDPSLQALIEVASENLVL
jgi:hypothetical protein